MKKLVIPLILLLLSIVLLGVQVLDNYERVSKEDAEEIALEDAKSKGYNTAFLWKEFDVETRAVYVYSADYNKDVRAWKVFLDTEEHPDIMNSPALIYFISVDSGEVITTINALEKEG
ncbi:hypothetical protein [Lysinibacillus telephonicus]|uniref:Uncharacterized protein n=1 Tax=Lysinibacillus telephonicus TaxID=1714840 RepID=A0A431UF64_9BACI|nr:hypothetical protein [Lysinibacillus telephonicus]RTQ87956.1 hypothetical protein EKG35_18325 [Lysinibacillus telephonicus]